MICHKNTTNQPKVSALFAKSLPLVFLQFYYKYNPSVLLHLSATYVLRFEPSGIQKESNHRWVSNLCIAMIEFDIFKTSLNHKHIMFTIICHDNIGKLNIVVSLFGSYGRNFQETHDNWSCDISGSVFNFFLLPETRGTLFHLFFMQHVHAKYPVWTFYLHQKKKSKFLTTVISLFALWNNLCTFFTLWNSMSYFLIMYVCI